MTSKVMAVTISQKMMTGVLALGTKTNSRYKTMVRPMAVRKNPRREYPPPKRSIQKETTNARVKEITAAKNRACSSLMVILLSCLHESGL